MKSSQGSPGRAVISADDGYLFRKAEMKQDRADHRRWPSSTESFERSKNQYGVTITLILAAVFRYWWQWCLC